MSLRGDWLDDAFFEAADDGSADGGTTSHGALWHSVSPRWGHSMHPMCSYHGMFPAKLAHYFIQKYSQPGNLVVDPFSGRGTAALQARLEGRHSVSSDLNPLAYALTSAKSDPPSWAEVIKFVSELERGYRERAQADPDEPADIQMLFHKNTLKQLVFVRRRLLSKPLMEWSPVEMMVAGATAGILHGAHRADGSSQYLSISMPNTFSMAPEYVRKYIRENKLTKLDQNVFERLRDKLARLYTDATDGVAGRVYHEDASHLLSSSEIRGGSVDLLLTSPPYLRVVNYGTSNWIRLWWLGIGEVSRQRGAGRVTLDATLDHGHGYDSYRTFMLRTLKAARRGLRRDGVAVFVIGDVAKPGEVAVPLAAQLWEDVGAQSGLRLVELIEDHLPLQNKVSRIWGETRGHATDRDCVLVLARADGQPEAVSWPVDWEEPYKDSGPDAAHARLRRVRQAS